MLSKYFVPAVLLCAIGWRAWAGMWTEVGFGLLGGLVLSVLLGTWKRAASALLGTWKRLWELGSPDR